MLKVVREKELLKVVKRVAEVEKKSFAAVAKKRSYRVLLLFGGDQVEKL